MGWRMDLFDVAIIYLACGAPFAVQYSFRVKDVGKVEKAAKSMLAGLGWPLIAAGFAVEAVRQFRKPAPALNETKRLVDEIRSSLEEAVDLAGRPDAAFEFRRTVLRWAELAVAVRQPTEAPAVAGIWEINGHDTPDVAASAYSHREKRLIERHFDAARRDIIGLADSLRDNLEFRTRVIEAARTLGDEVSVDALTEKDDAASTRSASAPA
ncbi:MAG: hypothetical protein UZ17_ACD001002253 [Acidobacteria bacterium OLB17]|nr:MAG: hypothetical protein UZ17_ACD001002253 [Acidobacteria bacterium OLB17]